MEITIKVEFEECNACLWGFDFENWRCSLADRDLPDEDENGIVKIPEWCPMKKEE